MSASGPLADRPVATAVAVGVVAVALLVVARPRPEWRQLQDEHQAATVERLDAAIAEERARTRDEVARLESARTEALASLDSETVDELEREIFRLERQLRRAERARDVARRKLEADPTDETRAQRLERRAEVEGLEEMIDGRRSRLAELRSGVSAIEDELAAARAPTLDLERALATASTSRRLADLQVGPEGERCVACHAGPHPMPELLGPGSLHPWEAVGCVVCHGGDGDAVGVLSSGHGPTAPRHSSASWNPRIVAGGLAESGCVACHVSMDALWPDDRPGGGWQHAGLRVAASLGCGGCHETGRALLDGSPAASSYAGPSLVDLSYRLTRDEVAAHLRDPRADGVPAWMPALWAGANGATRETEIAAVVEFLWSTADSTGEEQAVPRGGDPEQGRRLVAQVGCLACHLAVDEAVDVTVAEPGRTAAAPDLSVLERRRGPHLARAARLDPSWLAAWLRAPSAVHPSTSMPSLRLSEREIRDVVAHLTASTDDSAGESTDAEPPSPIDATIRDRLLHDALLVDGTAETTAETTFETTVEAAAAFLADRDPEERLLELGRRVVVRTGCAGCHLLPSAVEAPAGPSLVDVGPRLARRVDLDDPDWLDALHPSLGRFELSPTQSTALLAQVLGWRGSPETAHDTVDDGQTTIERLGCRTCHAVDTDSTWAPSWSTAARRPPALERSGRLLRPSWIAAQLDQPRRRHPEAAPLRMPAFPFRDGEIPVVVATLGRLADAPIVDTPRAIDPLDVTVGGILFEVLDCSACHRRAIDAEEAELEIELSGTVLKPRTIEHEAPRYVGAGGRLRHDALVAWLLDPRSIDPHTAMPVLFPPSADGEPDASYLADTLEAPMFFVPRSRLRRVFESDADYRAYVSDAEQVARALAAYLSTLE